MDFFGQQDEARRRTRRLVVLFALAVGAIVLAVYLAIAIFAAANDLGGEGAHGVWSLQLFALVAGGTLAVISGGSLYKTAALARGGGESVAALLGGEPLDPGSSDVAERRLLNVVEEMALASGTAVPSVYLLREEGAINAFAAGLSRDAAVVGMTRGSLEHLDRDELQGVVAHEFSHILNGDMRLNLRLMGLLHGILVISLIGYWILRGSSRSSGSSKKKGGSLALLGLALYLIGWVGVFFGELIKSAISRQREFLADAAAVQFTRNPSGIAGALKKIGGLGAGSKLQARNAAQASHLFFGNGLAERRFAWRSTHPPLPERIRRLDPGWDGAFPRLAGAAAGGEGREPREPRGRRAAAQAARRGEAGAAAPLARPAAHLGEGAAGRTPAPVAMAMSPAQVAAVAGQPGPVHLAAAAGLLAALPTELLDRAREPMAARAVVLALLCDRDAAARALQLDAVRRGGDALLLAELERMLPPVATLPAEARLPLLDLTLPALRRLSESQYRAFRSTVDALVAADQRLTLFEYALHRVLLRHLEPAFAPGPPPRVSYYSLRQLGHPCAVLLSTLAHAGATTPEGAAAAFAAGAAALGPRTPPGLALLPSGECTFRRLDDALTRLSAVAPARLRELVAACGAAVAHDGLVSGAEGELLRAVADALGCPVPPLVGGAGAA
jgi:Zn-dependent protease with chaperone function